MVTAGNLGLMSYAAADDTKPDEATFKFRVNGSGYDTYLSLKYEVVKVPTVSAF